MKPPASLSLDLDNQWSYMKTHGDKGWEEYPSYFDILIPHVIEILEDLGLKITFFIVGRDAALEKNRDSLKLITEKGHEVGNHSFHHEPWLHLYSKTQLEKEILEAEVCIQKVTGQKPAGFRGPGFSWSPDLFEILIENGYLYDASTLPTFLGPLARMYYFWKSDLTEKEKKQRKGLFGGLREGLRPVKPYRWILPSGNDLIEIPVTTIPIFKTPFHLSYLLYLSRFSSYLMTAYINTAIASCRMTGTAPSFLLHPLDLLGKDQVQELAFFPGMDIESKEKTMVFKQVLGTLGKHFRLVSMSVHAASVPYAGTKNIRLAA